MPALELIEVDKWFGPVHANRSVSLVLRRGSVHAVLGENGAGKSTLMNILFGVEQPDSGSILLGGQRRVFRTPKDAINAGVGMVFQHFGLVPELSALDNIALGAETTRRGRVDRSRAADRIGELAAELRLEVFLSRRVADLTVAQQQRVEILKALYRGARILILDEPTALLAPPEREGLFAAVRRLQAIGVSVLFITHKLEEAEQLADDVTVMRHGAVVARRKIGRVTRATLIADMVGGRPAQHTHSERVPGDVVAELRGVGISRGADVPLTGVDLQIRAGEIVGVVGIDGHGQQLLCEALAGMRQPDDGTLLLRGNEQRTWNRAAALRARVAYVPEDRLTAGVARHLSIAENLVLNRVGDARFFPRGLTARKAMKANADALIDRFDIRCRDGSQHVGSLSGGNVQKVVLARELSRDPRLVIVREPTRGLDVAAIANVHAQLAVSASGGAAVLVQSSDLDEIRTIADRILVMRDGRVVADLVNDASVQTAQLGALMLGAARTEEA
ncbi:ABC transporter ATP-binding protein [Actinoplanes sp. NPDC051470]|uniref:ABC transporter ATP-binding protein n=1 Tax=Actinoplanes sp. NPDC051470 TaxID=3157224 RepID=UPI00343D16C4